MGRGAPLRFSSVRRVIPQAGFEETRGGSGLGSAIRLAPSQAVRGEPLQEGVSDRLQALDVKRHVGGERCRIGVRRTRKPREATATFHPRVPWLVFTSMKDYPARPASQIVCRLPLPALRAGTWTSSTVNPTRRSR